MRKAPSSAAARTVRLGPQGRLVLPADLRRELGLSAGDELEVQVRKVKRAEAALEAVRRAFAGSRGRSLTRELITERRREAKREQRKAR